MPPLMHSALLKVDTEVVDEADADADDEGIATVLVQTDTGSKRVALKTSLLEEKATACNMLVCYFSELGEGMFNYIETVATEMVKLLSYVYSEEVRTAAAALMPELIKAAVNSRDKGLCDQSFVAGLSKLVFEKLITTVKEEPETDVQLAMIEGLQVCVCVVCVCVYTSAGGHGQRWQHVLGQPRGCDRSIGGTARRLVRGDGAEPESR